MGSFFDWLSNSPIGIPVFLVVLALVVAIVVTFQFLAIQGREVSIWPPKIGGRKDPVSKSATEPSAFHAETSAELSIGLEAYSQDSRGLDSVKTTGLRKCQVAWLIGATMHYTLSNSKDWLAERITEGLRLRVLLADPAGRDYEATARSFGQNRKELLRESELSLIACQNISKSLELSPYVKGALEVRVMDCVFTAGVYFFDPSLETGKMILVPHIPGRDTPNVPGFAYGYRPDGLLVHYFEIYEGVWKKALPLDRWLIDNDEFLA